jgi:hypothetical protein
MPMPPADTTRSALVMQFPAEHGCLLLPRAIRSNSSTAIGTK